MKKVDVLGFGEPLIGLYQKNDEAFQMTIGGDVSNVVSGVARLGHSSALITRIGEDVFGEMLTSFWKSRGVSTDFVERDPKNSTGLYIALSSRITEHSFMYYRKHSAFSTCNFEPHTLQSIDFTQVNVFFLTGISQAVSRNCLELSFELLEKAKSAGTLIAYDVNYRAPLWSKNLAAAVISHTIRKFVDILILGKDEIFFLEKVDNDLEKIAKRLLSMGPKIVALKLGEEGALLVTKEGKILFSEAFKVETEDTVGAGDGFTAGLITGLLENMALEESLELANAVAAMICRSTGSTLGQPTKEEVNSFIKTNKGR